jgi:cytochrome c oxidase assembly factor CtaG
VRLAPDLLWRDWSLDPTVVVPLVLGGALYARGLRALWQRGGLDAVVTRWRAAAYFGGLLALALALLSPLDVLAAALFSAHMVQHLILVLGVPPLLVLGEPLLPLLWALPLGWRRRLGRDWLHRPGLRRGWRMLAQPAAAVSLHALAIWTWHLPALYQAALASPALHAAEHLCFLGTALLFWWLVLAPRPDRGGYGGPILATLATAFQSGVLGILLTFASQPWYPAYAGTTAAWGLTPQVDQQLAGLIMWIPPATIYLLAVLALLGAWLGTAEPDDADNGVPAPPVTPLPEGQGKTLPTSTGRGSG